MRTPHFEQAPSAEPPRFTERPAPGRAVGPGDFARNEQIADKAKAQHEALKKELKSKQVTVQGDFKPENLPPHLSKFLGQTTETVWLEGPGPDGTLTEIRRGVASCDRMVANTDQVATIRKVKNENGVEQTGVSAAFVTAKYVRTKRISNEGYVIFQFVKPAAAV